MRHERWRKVIVWTRLSAPAEHVWGLRANVDWVSDRLPAPLGWSFVDPGGAQALWNAEGPGRTTVRVGTGMPWRQDLVLHVTDAVAGLRVHQLLRTGSGVAVAHRMRLERTIGDGARWVDEIVYAKRGVLAPALGRAVVAGVRHLHAAMARDLDEPDARTGQSRGFAVGHAAREHLDAIHGTDRVPMRV